uniref:Uncharacterized protein n=1 Tax=Rhizophora mucronata TaxID=61149 RepID=A0A2P2NR89_RHIMU
MTKRLLKNKNFALLNYLFLEIQRLEKIYNSK